MHHIRVNDRDLRNIIHIHADELAFALHISDDIVDGDLGGRAGGSGNCNGKDGMVLRRRHAFQGTDVSKLRILDDDADRFCGIHHRSSAHCDNAVCVKCLERLHTSLDVFYGGIGFHIRKERICDPLLIQHVGDLLDLSGFHHVAAGSDERPLVSSCGQLIADFGDRAGSMIGNCIEYDAICHSNRSFLLNFCH